MKMTFFTDILRWLQKQYDNSEEGPSMKKIHASVIIGFSLVMEVVHSCFDITMIETYVITNLSTAFALLGMGAIQVVKSQKQKNIQPPSDIVVKEAENVSIVPG